jgi:isocitrate dehydrogenase
MIENALERTIMAKAVTYDLQRLSRGATKLKYSELGEVLVDNMEG